jgi:hypothetical protein
MAVIYALDRCTPAEHGLIEKVRHERAFNGVTHQDVLAILERYDAVHRRWLRPLATPTKLAKRSIRSPTPKPSAP